MASRQLLSVCGVALPDIGEEGKTNTMRAEVAEFDIKLPGGRPSAVITESKPDEDAYPVEGDGNDMAEDARKGRRHPSERIFSGGSSTVKVNLALIFGGYTKRALSSSSSPAVSSFNSLVWLPMRISSRRHRLVFFIPIQLLAH